MGQEAGQTTAGMHPIRCWLLLSTVMLCLLQLACSDRDAEGPRKTPAASADAAAVALRISSPGGVSATVTVELAATEKERERGLMFRDSLAEDRGMLFLFATDQRGGFWMKNTRVPLTIAYLDVAGRVLELHDGKPFDETSLLPSQPYRHALEVNQGWFARHGLEAGATVELPGKLPVPE